LERVLYFLKRAKIESKSGIGSIPDGFILSLPHKKWYILDSTKEEPLLIREQGQTIEISLSWDETLDQILKVARLVLKQGKSFSEAVKIVAREKNIHESTVRDKCTRRIGLNTEQFQELLKDRARLTNFLIKKFPAGVQIIYEDLK